MNDEEVMIPKSYHDKVCEEIIRFKDKQFYDAVHLLDDGTLEITVGDYTKVKRVLVEDCNNFGNLFYENDTDRPQGEWVIEEFLWGGYVRMKKPKCSVCKIGIDHLAIVLEDGSGWDMYKTADGSFRNLPRFCPHCGAKMKGADDE